MLLFHSEENVKNKDTGLVIREIINEKGFGDGGFLAEYLNRNINDNDLRKHLIVIFNCWLIIDFHINNKNENGNEDYDENYCSRFLMVIDGVEDIDNHWEKVQKFLKEQHSRHLALLYFLSKLKFFDDNTYYLIGKNWKKLERMVEKVSINIKKDGISEYSISTLQSLLQRIKEAMEMKERIKAIEAALPTSVDRIEELMTLRKDFESLKTQITEQDHPDIIEERLNNKYTLFVAAFAILFIFGTFLLIFIPSIKGY